ncbi:long-chain fatty acid transporter, partial [Vibrio vulnificus]
MIYASNLLFKKHTNFDTFAYIKLTSMLHNRINTQLNKSSCITNNNYKDICPQSHTLGGSRMNKKNCSLLT